MPRALALCADDFGLAPGVSATIVALAQRGRLTATSCLVNLPGWAVDAPRLSELPPQVHCGLHFNLTEGAPLSASLRARWPRLPAIGTLLRDSLLHRLPAGAIADELQAQWAAFTAARGRAPDFVDGHQHVHHLRGVRESVLACVAAAAERGQPVAVRGTGRLLGPQAGLKRRVLMATGGRALQRELQRRHIAHNPVLLGAYDFVEADYRALMRAWLAALPPEGGLLFCHPGRDDPGDIGAAREREADYLGSDAFVADLAEAGVALTNAAFTGTSSVG